MLQDEAVNRLNPKTNAVENLEILFFSMRKKESRGWGIPVLTNCHPYVHYLTISSL